MVVRGWMDASVELLQEWDSRSAIKRIGLHLPDMKVCRLFCQSITTAHLCINALIVHRYQAYFAFTVAAFPSVG
jgi:hypothetical protein